jgi:hypothetical protein
MPASLPPRPMLETVLRHLERETLTGGYCCVTPSRRGWWPRTRQGRRRASAAASNR